MEGYKFKLSVWSWEAAVYEEQEEPSDWGNQAWVEVASLEEMVAMLKAEPFSWGAWLEAGESFQSKVNKRSKKVVRQAMVSVACANGSPLGYEDREFLSVVLGIG